MPSACWKQRIYFGSFVFVVITSLLFHLGRKSILRLMGLAKHICIVFGSWKGHDFGWFVLFSPRVPQQKMRSEQ